MILAGDVGGTKIHLALYRAGTGPLEKRAESLLPTAGTPDLAEAVSAFAATAETPVRAVALGVAGPLAGAPGEETVLGTNLPWNVATDSLAARLGGRPVRLVNDLVASAHALDDLAPSCVEEIQAGEPAPGATRAIVSPGTGLGECLVSGSGEDLVAIGSEGGHADFAPANDEQVDLWRFLRARHGRVAWERVVSGPGIGSVHAWLRASGRFAGDPGAGIESGAPGAPAQIASAATAGTSGLCAETMRVWMEAFGAEAGNTALRGTARGGVYLGGGIPGRVLALLRDGPFLECFRAKEPHRELLARIPVWVVTDQELAVRGAAHIARRMLD